VKTSIVQAETFDERVCAYVARVAEDVLAAAEVADRSRAEDSIEVRCAGSRSTSRTCSWLREGSTTAAPPQPSTPGKRDSFSEVFRDRERVGAAIAEQPLA
jgi:hypothetical protein